MDDFLVKAYSRRYVLRHRRLFEWMYRHPTREGRASVICAYQGDEIISILGYIVTEFFWGGVNRVITGAWPTNWATLDKVGVGAGWPLVRRLQRMFEVLVGNGPSKMNRDLVPRLGFTIHHRTPRHVAVLQKAQVIELLRKGPRQLGEWPIQEYQVNPPKVMPGGFLAHKNELDPEAYSPDWKLYPALHFGAVRSARYIKQKYLDHPYLEYKVVTCGPKTAPSLCIYRIETTTGVLRTRVGRILEFFHPQTAKGLSNGVDLLSHVLDDLRYERCIFCDFFCSSDGFNAALIRAGLTLEGERFLPHRLNPIEFDFDKGEQSIELYASESYGRVPELREMYVTKSDGDQDRPNMPFEEDRVISG